MLARYKADKYKRSAETDRDRSNTSTIPSAQAPHGSLPAHMLLTHSSLQNTALKTAGTLSCQHETPRLMDTTGDTGGRIDQSTSELNLIQALGTKAIPIEDSDSDDGWCAIVSRKPLPSQKPSEPTPSSLASLPPDVCHGQAFQKTTLSVHLSDLESVHKLGLRSGGHPLAGTTAHSPALTELTDSRITPQPPTAAAAVHGIPRSQHVTQDELLAGNNRVSNNCSAIPPAAPVVPDWKQVHPALKAVMQRVEVYEERGYCQGAFGPGVPIWRLVSEIAELCGVTEEQKHWLLGGGDDLLAMCKRLIRHMQPLDGHYIQIHRRIVQPGTSEHKLVVWRMKGMPAEYAVRDKPPSWDLDSKCYNHYPAQAVYTFSLLQLGIDGLQANRKAEAAAAAEAAAEAAAAAAAAVAARKKSAKVKRGRASQVAGSAVGALLGGQHTEHAASDKAVDRKHVKVVRKQTSQAAEADTVELCSNSKQSNTVLLSHPATRLQAKRLAPAGLSPAKTYNDEAKVSMHQAVQDKSSSLEQVCRPHAVPGKRSTARPEPARAAAAAGKAAGTLLEMSDHASIVQMVFPTARSSVQGTDAAVDQLRVKLSAPPVFDLSTGTAVRCQRLSTTLMGQKHV